ncbi:ice-binding family protein [Oricola indica]|uniref:ice-binding family protein n=1 Tax=Oricola indica TaxID=2872591 RepID=UPI001CBC32EE
MSAPSALRDVGDFEARFRRMRFAAGAIAALVPFSAFNVPGAQAQDLDSFAILAGSGITNTGATTIYGNIGSSPTGSYTGSGSVTQTGSVYLANAVAALAQNELTTLYNYLEGQPTSLGGDLTGQELGGMTLLPGAYNFDSSAGLSAGQTLTLDGNGDPDATFVINIGSTLTAGSGSTVLLQNGAQGGNVFFRVGSSATLDTSANFVGQIVAYTSITLNTSADILCGAALARNGAVALDSNTIGICVLTSGTFVDSLDDMDDSTETSGNATSVADALDDYVSNGGILPQSFTILAALMTPQELADALEQMAGETATGVAPTGMQAMDSFLDVALNHRSFPTAPATPAAPTGPATVSVLGYVSPTDTASDQPFRSIDADRPPPSLSTWAGGYGGYREAGGDAVAGTHERTSRDYGLALGVDYHFDNNTTIGIAVAAGRSSFEIGELGSGNADTYHVALHARTETDAVYLVGAVAYGYSDVDTNRTVTIAGTDSFNANFAANDVAGHIEAGYTLGWITPYAALRAQTFRTPAYSEVTVAGVSTYALDYEARTATSIRSELGVGVEWSPDTTLTLSARAAWVHEYGSDTDVAAQFQSIAGAGFDVAGAESDTDSVQVSAGADVGLYEGLFLASSIGGRFGVNAQAYSGNIKLGYNW